MYCSQAHAAWCLELASVDVPRSWHLYSWGLYRILGFAPKSFRHRLVRGSLQGVCCGSLSSVPTGFALEPSWAHHFFILHICKGSTRQLIAVLVTFLLLRSKHHDQGNWWIKALSSADDFSLQMPVCKKDPWKCHTETYYCRSFWKYACMHI